MSRSQENKLYAYVDGELSPHQEVELEKELERSPELSRRLSELRELKRSVKSAFEFDVDESLFDGFAEEVSKKAAKTENTPLGFTEGGNNYPFRTVAAVAAVLIVALLAFGFGHYTAVNGGADVLVHEVQVYDGTDMEVVAPEGANYSIIKVAPKKKEGVSVSHVETAEGYDFEVEPSIDSNSITIKLQQNDEDGEERE
ncbi:MAG: hypothetical protein U5N86_01650 [Planctomycetota bacterium]|nr:hypothetical protein [Planctomycetota bacterium]